MLDPHIVADAPVRRVLAPIAFALAFAFGVPAVAANTFFAVVPVSAAGTPGQMRPVKIALAGATPPAALVGESYEFNLGALLSLDGPEGTEPGKVTWSVVSGSLPAGLALVGDRVVGVPTELAPSRQVIIQAEYVSAQGTVGAMASYSFDVPVVALADMGSYRAWADGTYAPSCEGYIRSGSLSYPYQGAVGDGVYRISPAGAPPLDVYCDQSSDGGGWTRVALEYEGSAVAWTGAQSGASYTLAQAQIPPHIYTGFGRDNLATFVDYAPFQYSTGNLALTAVVSPKTGYTYQIHRNLNEHYSSHDPETVFLGPTPVGWNNTLTFDRVGVKPGYNFAFAPFYPTLEGRGYALGGAPLYNSQEAFGWSVWVK